MTGTSMPTVSTTNYSIGHVPTYNYKVNNWTVYLSQLNQYFIANDITDQEKKRAIMLTSFTEETYVLTKNICIPHDPTTKTFDYLVKQLTDHFKPVISTFAARHHFYNARRAPEQSISEWAATVKTLAASCGFGAELNTLLRDIFVSGIGSGILQDRLMEEDATSSSTTFASVLSIALAREAAAKDRSSRSDTTAPIKEEPMFHARDQRKSNWRRKSRNNGSGSNSSVICTACGRTNHSTEKCRYLSYTCNICGVRGHLAPVCPSKKSTPKWKNKGNNKYKGKSTSNKFLNDDSEDTSDNNLFNLKSNDLPSEERKPFVVFLNINDKKVKFEIDTGSAQSVISYDVFKKLFSRMPLQESDRTMKDYIGNIISPVGKVKLSCTYKNKDYDLELYVVEGGGPPLLGRIGIKSLNIDLSNISKNYKIDSYCNGSVNNFGFEFPKLFSPGIGSFNKYKVNLPIKPDAQPKFIKAHKIPIALKPKVEQEIDRLVRDGVLVQVDYCDWGTPVVPVLKSDTSVRLCGNFKITVNPALLPFKYPLPRVDHLFAEI